MVAGGSHASADGAPALDEASRFAQVKALFGAVCDLPAGQREAWLKACGEEAWLIDRVQVLLQAEAVTDALDAPVIDMLADLVHAEQLTPGTRLGAWTLLRKIGEGGMGSVYEAQRSDGHFEQSAAIKLLRGMPSPAALAFLTSERQILARLSHPHIARLLDGGATPSGQPYLVMEYLHGCMPIDQYCHERQLPLAAMLRLLLSACAAVSFAHSRLVVHCDLKPSNILVDENGHPWLVDFGIARLLVNEPAEPEVAGTPVRAFTPGYASPEQERGEAVSTLSDVYSLGHLLQHLLQTSAAAPVLELQAIVTQATRIEPTARYPSVAALAADLGRYLDRRPLQAMPATLTYRGRKLLQRRWPVLLAGLAFMLTVLAFTLQLAADRDRALAAERRALNERDRAAQAELSARQISQFLGNILSSVDPDNARAMDRTLMRSLLDQAAERARVELQDNPLVLRQVESVVADSYRAISDFAAAVSHYDAALGTFPNDGGAAGQQQRLELGYRKLLALIDGSEVQQAGALLPELLEQARLLGQPAAEMELRLQTTQARLLFLRGEQRAALQSARATQQLFEHSGMQSPEPWLQQLNILGLMESNHHHFDSAEARMRQAIDIATRHHGAQHSTTLRARQSLGVMLIQSRRLTEAVQVLRELLGDCKRALGPSHLLSISVLSNLGMALRFSGDLHSSAPFYQQAHARALERFGATHPLTLDLANNLAVYEIAADLPAQALTRIDAVLLISQQIHPRTHPSLLEALRTRAKALAALQRKEESRQVWADVVERDIEVYGPEDPNTLDDQQRLAELLGTQSSP